MAKIDLHEAANHLRMIADEVEAGDHGALILLSSTGGNWGLYACGFSSTAELVGQLQVTGVKVAMDANRG